MTALLAPILQEFFTAHLVTQRAVSAATIRAYRDTWMGLTPDGGHLTGGTAGPAGRMSVCRASVVSTPRSFGSRLPAW
jgi:hypothetical protein